VIIFSPAVRPLLQPGTDPRQSLASLRAQEVRFVFLPRHNPFNTRQLAGYPVFHFLKSRPPTHTLMGGDVYDLFSPELISLGSETSSSSPR
jgi:hypothetical protein